MFSMTTSVTKHLQQQQIHTAPGILSILLNMVERIKRFVTKKLVSGLNQSMEKFFTWIMLLYHRVQLNSNRMLWNMILIEMIWIKVIKKI